MVKEFIPENARGHNISRTRLHVISGDAIVQDWVSNLPHGLSLREGRSPTRQSPGEFDIAYECMHTKPKYL